MINQIFSPAPDVTTVVTAETNVFAKLIDLRTLFSNGLHASVEVTIAAGATAPGAARTVTLYAAFTNDATATPAELANAVAVAAKVCSVPNTASIRRMFNLGALVPTGRYLVVWYDHTALDAGAVLTLTTTVTANS